MFAKRSVEVSVIEPCDRLARLNAYIFSCGAAFTGKTGFDDVLIGYKKIRRDQPACTKGGTSLTRLDPGFAADGAGNHEPGDSESAASSPGKKIGGHQVTHVACNLLWQLRYAVY